MSDPIDLNTIISRREDLMTSELSETEVVMLNVERGYYYGMQSTATVIWNNIREPRSIADLCDYLMTQFSVERADCERDVLAFVGELMKDGLIHVVE